MGAISYISHAWPLYLPFVFIIASSVQRGLVRTTGGKTTPKTKKNQQSGKGKKPTKRVVLRKQTLGGSIVIKKKKSLYIRTCHKSP